MTKPPCMVDGIDCPHRYIGCRASCEAWHEWLAIHEAEKERARKARYNEVDVFLCDQPKRKKLARKREYMKERNRL